MQFFFLTLSLSLDKIQLVYFVFGFGLVCELIKKTNTMWRTHTLKIYWFHDARNEKKIDLQMIWMVAKGKNCNSIIRIRYIVFAIVNDCNQQNAIIRFIMQTEYFIYVFYKYWRSLPKKYIYTHIRTQLYISTEMLIKILVYNVNLPLKDFAAEIWPKTDHWQTDRTRTVTTMCWVFIFSFCCCCCFCCYTYFLSVFFLLFSVRFYFVSILRCKVKMKKKNERKEIRESKF